MLVTKTKGKICVKIAAVKLFFVSVCKQHQQYTDGCSYNCRQQTGQNYIGGVCAA